MIKKVACNTLLVSILVLLNGCMGFNGSQRTSLYHQTRNAAVEILVDGHLEGSGWFADSHGYVITAAHAVNRTNITIEVLSESKGRLPAEVVAIDRGHDIALLLARGGTEPYPFLKVSTEMPQPEDNAYLYGSALYNHGIMLGGTVARDGTTFTYYRDRKMLVRCYHITSPSPPGTSGGPWIDRRGHVIGNQSGFITHNGSGAGIAIVAPPNAIRNLIASKKTLPTPTIGCGLEELWTQSPGFIKRFPRGTEGVITIPIDKAGPADIAGLNTESLIVAVEGKSIRYKDDLYRVVHGRKPGDIINISVMDPDKTTRRDVQIKLGRLESETK